MHCRSVSSTGYGSPVNESSTKRMISSVCCVAALALAAGCGSSSAGTGAPEGSDSAAPVTADSASTASLQVDTIDSTTTVAVATTDQPPSTDGSDGEIGTLTVIMRSAPAQINLSETNLELLAARLRDRVTSLNPAATVAVVDGGAVEVVITGYPEPDRDALFSLLEVTGMVSFRPVFACGLAGQAAPAPSSASATTTQFSDPSQPQVLENNTKTEVCQVGPSQGSGELFDGTAEASIIAGSWGVTANLKPGSGEDGWNAIAVQCYERQSSCPSGRLAIEIDGIIMASPTLNSDKFEGSVQISGDFTEHEAETLANVLNAGALPARLLVESVEFTPG